MSHVVDTISGGMTYIPSFIKIGSSFQKLSGGKHVYTHSKAISKAYFYILKIRNVT
jgi:hypothetical protein